MKTHNKGNSATAKLFEAIKLDIIPRTQALRLLEAQDATGGIIDVDKNYRVSLDRALEKGLIPEDVKNILEETKLPEFRLVEIY